MLNKIAKRIILLLCTITVVGVLSGCTEYNLIEDGDKIAVAVSGGKDSLALLYALAGLKRFYPASFTICAIKLYSSAT